MACCLYKTPSKRATLEDIQDHAYFASVVFADVPLLDHPPGGLIIQVPSIFIYFQLIARVCLGPVYKPHFSSRDDLKYFPDIDEDTALKASAKANAHTR